MHLTPSRHPLRDRDGRPHAGGFTLIEVVLVLVVLALAGALVVPAVQPALEAARAEAAARRTAAFLDDARRRSVVERKVQQVRCRPRDERLERVGEGGAVFRIPEKVALVSCSPDQVLYFPQGSSSGLTLVLRDRRGRERRVTVGSFTGLAKIETAP